jgi:MFS family permease
MALVTAPWLIALGALSAMTSEQVASMAQYTLRLRLIPDELQGRVNSAYRLLLLLSQPVGLAVGGALLDQLGVQATLVIGSLILAAVVFAGAIPLAPTRQATQATARTRLARLARQWRRSAQFLHSQYVRRALEGDITQGRTGK